MRRSATISIAAGVELHYLTEGSGRPLVFIHGLWASGRFFDRQLTALGRRHRTIAVDLRGHGQSTMTLRDQTVSVYAQDLRMFLHRLAVEQPVLIGWSMGAFVIWDYVRQFGSAGIAAAVIVDQAPSDFRSAAEPDGFCGGAFASDLASVFPGGSSESGSSSAGSSSASAWAFALRAGLRFVSAVNATSGCSSSAVSSIVALRP